MPELHRLDDIADHVRAKNAGPFWMTLDVFFGDAASYERVVGSGSISAEAIGRLYRVDAATVRVFNIPTLNVVKISFPRKDVQGGLLDRDMHAGQQHVPLAHLRVP